METFRDGFLRVNNKYTVYHLPMLRRFQGIRCLFSRVTQITLNDILRWRGL